MAGDLVTVTMHSLMVGAYRDLAVRQTLLNLIKAGVVPARNRRADMTTCSMMLPPGKERMR